MCAKTVINWTKMSFGLLRRFKLFLNEIFSQKTHVFRFHPFLGVPYIMFQFPLVLRFIYFIFINFPHIFKKLSCNLIKIRPIISKRGERKITPCEAKKESSYKLIYIRLLHINIPIEVFLRSAIKPNFFLPRSLATLVLSHISPYIVRRRRRRKSH